MNKKTPDLRFRDGISVRNEPGMSQGQTLLEGRTVTILDLNALLELAEGERRYKAQPLRDHHADT
jgi:hypothetical protein